MISYELAKQLKDAGFPQTHIIYGRYFDDRIAVKQDVVISSKLPIPSQEKDFIKAPTLSELIEACGDGFNSLEKYSTDRWRCVKWVPHLFKCEDGVTRKGCLWEGNNWGFTPEEAVAKLYLELKSKKVI